MSKEWLNLFLKFSGFTFGLKQKIAKGEKWHVVFPSAVLLIFSELLFEIFLKLKVTGNCVN